MSDQSQARAAALIEVSGTMETGADTSFGQVLRERRGGAGLTQEALAERAGISVRSIQALEGGGAQPRRDTTRRLGAALGLRGEERARFLAAAALVPRPHRSSAADIACAATPAPTHNLPLELTSFVGRVEEVAALGALLAETRLLTLVGAGGVGKTRLALRVAATALPAFDDGVRLVELAPLAEPEQLPRTVAAVLGIRDDPDRPPIEALISGIARRRLLLLLDNCEHLIEACATLAEAVLRGCPRARILATSREALRCGGETTWRVPSLALPAQPVTDPTEVAACDAVRLFVERARAAQPGFHVTAATSATVAQACRRLDGIPLALELAAARLRGLSLEELTARLDERFRLLTAGRRTALPRQQTLRATVEWSYGLLEEQERLLFDRLSVFAPGFDLRAAEAVCAAGTVAVGDVLDLLLRLVDKSLVEAERRADGTTRYRLLETLRQYGRERLAGRAEATEVRERHAGYFLAQAETALAHLMRSGQPATLEDLIAKRDDLQAAFAWFQERGMLAQGLRLRHALKVIWVSRGTTEGRALLTQLLASPELAAPSVERAQALIWAGGWLCEIGDVAGLALLEEALDLARRLGDLPVLGEALWLLGCKRHEPWGDVAGARPLLEEALACYRALGERWHIAEALGSLVQVVCALGEPALAAALASEFLELSRASGNPRHLAWAVEFLGEVAHAQGDDATAGSLWRECLETFRRRGEAIGTATAGINLGRLAYRQGRYAEARQHFSAVLAFLRGRQAVGVAWGLPALVGLAGVAATERRWSWALRLAGTAAATYQAHGFHMAPADREALDRAVTLGRAGLGEPASTAAWAEGRAMPLEEAVALALEDECVEPDHRTASRSSSS